MSTDVGEYALERFRRFCREIGGRVEEGSVVLCVLDVPNVWDITDHLFDFYDLIRELKKVLPKPVELTAESKLIGGVKEEASVFFDPKDDEFTVYAKVYSHGTEASGVEDVRTRVIVEEKEWRYNPIKGSSSVHYNYAAEAYAGCGEAYSTIKRIYTRSHRDLEELLEKTINLADELAERAEEELIIYRKEEEEEEW